jgi:N-acetylmuramoyl-L-alanine amidase
MGNGRRNFHKIFASASLGFALACAIAIPCPASESSTDSAGSGKSSSSSSKGSASSASTGSMKREAASAQFARAEELRAALNAKAWDKRTLADYKRVVTSYQRVYLITPHAMEVPDAILAVAELNSEMGDRFGRTYYQSSVDAYNYLVKEYPTSKYVQDATLRVAKLQKDQLGDPAAATKTYQEFQKNYPRSPRKREVQEALAELALQKSAETGEAMTAKNAPAPTKPAEDLPSRTVNTAATAAPAPRNASPTTVAVRNEAPAAADESTLTTGGEDAPAGEVPRVQRIRTNVTADSTEVIIELEDAVQYVSGRIANPDRIYFDLYAARLSPNAARDSVKISGNMLSAVRVAQNKAGIVRVVLDVNGVKDYAASLMKRPARLLIELYGTSGRGGETQTAHAGHNGGKAPIKPSLSDSAIAVASAVTESTPEEILSRKTAIVPNTPEPKTVDLKSAEPKIVTKKPTAPAMASMVGPAAPPPAAATHPFTEADLAADASDAASAPARTKSNPTVTTAPATTAAADTTGSAAKAVRTKSVRTASAGTTPGTGPKPDLAQPSTSATPTRDGNSTLTRALGLKIGRIVIDAGHGGHDTGTIGPTGLMEKDLCLDVALRLGKLLEQKLPGAEIIYTRSDDTFIPLEERTRIANDAKADLFVSIHANSSPDHGARGIETYYLNLRGSAESMEVAARENAASQQGIHDLEDMVKKIARTEKIDESKELAEDIQDSLSKRIQKTAKPVKNRGVRKAPFVVLIGADMPSILTEISFLSNPADEQLLKKPEHRQRVAEGLYQGVSDYLQSLNSLNVQRTPRAPRPGVVSASEQTRGNN